MNRRGSAMIVTAAIAMSLVPGKIEPFDPSLPTMVNPYGIESMSGFLTTVCRLVGPTAS